MQPNSQPNTGPATAASHSSGQELLDTLTSWYAPWQGVRVLVTGLGVSGFSAADTLAELGALVSVVDRSESPVLTQRGETLRIVGVKEVLFGEEHCQQLPTIDGELPQLVVTSPGWRPDQPLLVAAAEAGIPIICDVELAWRVQDKFAADPELDPAQRPALPQWVAVTGTNGKTSTVLLAESMALAAGKRAMACGNVGVPVLDAIRNPAALEVLILELSSFQLHWSQSLSCEASVVLNLAEDHVDWHGSYAAYVAAKASIYERTRRACIYNEDQPATRELVAEADVVEGCRAIGFTTNIPQVSMLGVAEGLLVDRAFLAQRHTQALELASVEDFPFPPAEHMVANTLAAAALIRAIDISPEAIREGIRTFNPGSHRLQLVAQAEDILWINDSKATNPHAADAALGGFKSIVWIAGGLPKGVNYDELVRRHAHRLKALILIGEDPRPLSQSVQRFAPDVPIVRIPPLAEQPQDDSIPPRQHIMNAAVAQAHQLATAGDTVLLAPAAASMDQFDSYAQRGEAFIDAVAELMDGQGLTGA